MYIMNNEKINELVDQAKEIIYKIGDEQLISAFDSRYSGVKRYIRKQNKRQLYRQYMILGKLLIHYKDVHDIGENIIYLSKEEGYIYKKGNDNGKENS